MQLQAMERAEEQEQKLRQLNAILEQTQREINSPPAQADVEAASEREIPSAPDMTPHASPPSQSPAPRIQGLHEEMFNILPSIVSTVRGAASRVRQMPNVVASNPTDDSFEDILTQADHQIKWTSIAYPKRVRFMDRESKGMTSTPKGLGVCEPQGPEDISKIQKGEDMQLGRQH